MARKRPGSRRRRGRVRRKARSLRWRALPGLQVMVLSALAVSVVGALLGMVWAELPGPGSGRRVVVRWHEVPPADLAADELAARGLVASPRLFEAYLRWMRPSVRLRPGPHLLHDDLSARALVGRLARAGGKRATVAIPEGWNQVQIAERLDGLDVCTKRDFLKATSSRPLLDEIGIPAETAEGYLFPATYRFSVDSDPERVVRRLIGELRRRWAAISATRDERLSDLARQRGWREHEILTLASMVEREASNPKERRVIAGIFFNRLDDDTFRPRGRLQSDPTAGFGCVIAAARIPSCAGYAGRVTPEMLRDATNPYNTYQHAGLPPSPVANPGEGSIEAVLDPAKTDYMYFVSTGHGRHVFSRTLEEHERATRRVRHP